MYFITSGWMSGAIVCLDNTHEDVHIIHIWLASQVLSINVFVKF